MDPLEDYINPNFCLTEWLEGRDPWILDDGPGVVIPKRPDTYNPSPTKWGKCPDKARAIQKPRLLKQDKTNREFFFENVYPLVKEHLNIPAQKTFASYFPEKEAEMLRAAGFVLFTLGDKSQWCHPKDEHTFQKLSDLPNVTQS